MSGTVTSALTAAADESVLPTHGIQSGVWLLVLVPAVSAAVLLLLGRRADKWGHYLGTLVPIGLFIFALMLFFSLKSEPGAERIREVTLFSWIPVNSFQVDVGFLVDPLSLTFALLITGVGSLIHIYSLGYMAHDPGRRRFFAYLNLFIAAMLLLVLSDGYLLMYVGWEGVGLASYLLIAFWYFKPSAATAAKKAFIANRVGDVGLSLAIMLMFLYMGTTTFSGVFAASPNASSAAITAICLMLLLGACGKSGQFPLQTWLPDAMEGPTPVSALIHAATMVTAGVYVIARSAPLFDQAPTAQLVVTIVGVITLLYGCICGCAQDDLKRALAYSTVSQIGYMFLAVGLGPEAYAFGILHLLGHGFFKAGLFLGAGSVMHAMNDTIDMRRFGALRKYMPITFITFFLAYLSIIGFPGFSGFWSKDKIIESAFAKGGTSGTILGICAMLGAAITAFYMTRVTLMTFFGNKRWEEDMHPHEAPSTMTVPMILLAFGSVFAGGLLLLNDALPNWLAPSVGALEEGPRHVSVPVLMTFTLLLVAAGAAAAWMFFGRRPVPAVQPVGGPITVAARKALYADAFNEAVLMRPGQWLTRALVWFDNKGVDGVVNGLGAAFGGGSRRLRQLQTGFVRSYALSMLGGVAIILAALLAVRFQ